MRSDKITQIGGFPSASICHAGEYFYMVSGSYQFMPALPVYRSADCLQWSHIGYCVESHADFGSHPIIDSPTIRFHNGTFYVTFTEQRTMNHYIVQAKDVGGEWTMPATIDCGGNQVSIFFDGANNSYCTYLESNAIAICSFIPEMGQITAQPEIIYKSETGFHPHRPHIYKVGGGYGIITRNAHTESRTDVRFCLSDKINGPYVSNEKHDSLYDRITQSTIHVKDSLDVVQTATGEHWMVYTEEDAEDVQWHHLIPTTHVALLHGAVPKIDTSISLEDLEERDDFVLPELQPFWHFVGNVADEGLWSLEDRPGWLRLIPDIATLSTNVSPLMIARNQQDVRCTVATMLDFSPQQGQEEAGLTVYVDVDHHYEIAVTRLSEDEQRSIIVRRRIGSLSAVVAFQLIPLDGLVTLYVEATSDKYVFAFQLMQNSRVTLAEGETRYLSQEVTGCKSGVNFGLYATANGREGVTPAFFDWFDYIVPE